MSNIGKYESQQHWLYNISWYNSIINGLVPTQYKMYKVIVHESAVDTLQCTYILSLVTAFSRKKNIHI